MLDRPKAVWLLVLLPALTLVLHLFATRRSSLVLDDAPLSCPSSPPCPSCPSCTPPPSCPSSPSSPSCPPFPPCSSCPSSTSFPSCPACPSAPSWSSHPSPPAPPLSDPANTSSTKSGDRYEGIDASLHACLTQDNVSFYIITSFMKDNVMCMTRYQGGDWVWPEGKAPGMWPGEMLMTSLMRRSPYRTFDPAKATFFYIPLWPSCLLNNTTDTHAYLLANQEWKALYEQNPRRFFVSEQTNYNAAALGKFFFQGTVLHYEVMKPGDRAGKVWKYPSAREDKDVAVPYWASSSFLYGLPNSLLQNIHRQYTFMANWDQYKKREVRRPLNLLFQDPNGELHHSLAPNFGAKVNHDQYARLATSSVFCLVARGHSVATRSIFNYIAGGCIPILFSDPFNLPFSTQIPWDEMVIRAPDTFAINDTTNEMLEPMRSEMQAQFRRLVDNPQVQHFMRSRILKYRWRFFFGLGQPDLPAADWDSQEVPLTDNPQFWSEGSLLVESVLHDLSWRLLHGWRGLPGPTPKRTMADLEAQIDRLIALSSSPASAEEQSILSCLPPPPEVARKKKS